MGADQPARAARSGGSAATLPLFLIAVIGGGLLLAWSAYQGQSALVFALFITGVVFLLVLFRPEVGIFVILSTMLLTYPEILRGVGLFTINNVLGMTLGLILVNRTFSSQGTGLWFLQEKEVRLLIGIGILFVFSSFIADALLPQLRYDTVWHEDTQSWVTAKDFTFNWSIDFFSRLSFLIFFVTFVTDRKRIRAVLLIFLLCVLAAIPAAITSYMSGVSGGEADFRVVASPFGFGAGWTKNANRFAFMCVIGASLLFYFSIVTRHRRVLLFTLPGMVTLVSLVLLAGSRSGFIGLLMLGAWMLVQTRGPGRARLRVGMLILGVCAAFTFTTLTPSRVQERLLNLNPFSSIGEGSHSTEVRTATLGQALDLFRRYPVSGVGLGNFRWVNSHFHNNFKPPHNSYAWALAEGGIFCLILYLVFFRTLFRRLQQVRLAFKDDPILPRIGEWLLFYFSLFLFFSFFADVWLVEIHLYLIAGLGIALHRSTAETTPTMEVVNG